MNHVPSARIPTPLRPWRKGLALALGAVLAAALSIREVQDTLLYTVAPKTARDRNFLHLRRGGLDVYLLGTIHGKHLETPEFSLAHLGAVLRHVQPDLVLLEMRPEELQRGRWGDGPVEMPFAALLARGLGIPVDGVDWWQAPVAGGRRTDDRRDDRIFALLRARVPAAGKVLVLLGYSHVPEQQQRLVADGFAETDLPAATTAQWFEPGPGPFHFPAGMAAALRQRIQDVESEAATADPETARALRNVAQSRKALLPRIEEVGEEPAR